MSLIKIIGWIGGVLLLWAYFQLPSGSGDVGSRQTLAVSEEPGRIVLGWSGPVQEPMNERIAAALERYKLDQRPIVLMLNSPGGSIEHGRRVTSTIRAQGRPVETLVQKEAVCASMCVPIFLTGARRMADPDAYFMFHQASLNNSASDNMKRKELSASEKAAYAQTVRVIETHATDDFFRRDIGIRGVNKAWLARMREKIVGRDVWMSGQQLVDEGSGIVDRLVP